MQTVGSLRCDTLMVGLILPVMRQQRPDSSGILVGQRHRRNVLVAPRYHFVDPAGTVSALASVMDDDACAVNQEGSQVRVAALADVPRPVEILSIDTTVLL